MSYNYSVVVPYRDKYELFVKAIGSIPDREDIQIIIIDNAPQPLSHGQIPTKVQAMVTYTTSSPTKGAGCARNVGLQYAKGRYILFLDADDYFTTEAFAAFDKYLDKDYDIVFFKPTSIRLSDGMLSNRHVPYSSMVDEFLKTGSEGQLRYNWVTPWSKMFNRNFVITNGFLFDEIKASNDIWFSVTTGHSAKTVTADKAIVYVVTEGKMGSSLIYTKTEEIWFIRFQVMIRVNQYLKSIGKYKYHIRLLGGLRIAWKEFGFKTFLKFLKYAYDNKAGIF
ncbi:MAG: glycosyltransferase family 2 protein [Salinivirgaceae bacterium]|nr:glycosyltransferase family 2 protein [Salinivirgaceae bacterium]